MFRKNQRDDEEIKWMIAQEIPALRRYARLLTKNSERSDDLVQDTLERAIKKSHTWRREGQIKSWLYKVQYSVFVNKYYKAAHLREATSLESDEVAILSTSASQEKRIEFQRVMSVVNELPAVRRDVLLLIAVEGFSYDQAAQILDVPVGTVRSRLSRAREDLKDALEQAPMIGKEIKGKENEKH